MELSDAKVWLPFKVGAVVLLASTSEDLFNLRTWEEIEGFERLTCRPIKTRSKSELADMYHALLLDADKLICSVYLAETQTLIGKITATDFNIRNLSAEIGYFIMPQYRSCGYMHTALRGFCELLLDRLKLHKLYAQTGSFNEASIGLLKKCGFHLDGVLRAHHVLNGNYYDDYLYSKLK